MNGVAVATGLTSKRHEGSPLRQPLYDVRDVPRCDKEFQGSTVYDVNEREHFVDAMAEMVLLSKEAVRRSNRKLSFGKFSSKPLSAEYMADRLVSWAVWPVPCLDAFDVVVSVPGAVVIVIVFIRAVAMLAVLMIAVGAIPSFSEYRHEDEHSSSRRNKLELIISSSTHFWVF